MALARAVPYIYDPANIYNQTMEKMLKTPHIVLLASPGMGHLIPISELAKRLVVHHNFTATVITFSGFSSQSPHHLSLLSSLPPGITSLPLPHIPLDDLPPETRTKTPISTTIARSRPLLHRILLNLKSSGNLAAFIVDNLGLAALPVVEEIGILGYVLFTSCFTMLSVELHLPQLLETMACDLRDHPEPLRLPGCGKIRGRDLPEPIRNRSHPGHQLAIYHSKIYKEAAGILVNSFEALEPGPAEELRSGYPPAYPIGPLVRTRPSESVECLRWLDRQPEASVVFVSFGSAGKVSRVQAEELAIGLEMSKMRFLWVVRVAGEGEGSSVQVLPDGFVERTKEVGMVVEGWAPQMSVLEHVSTGGFMSHCGWNSVLESLVNGVAMAAWPLQHEQPMNAEYPFTLTDTLKLTIELARGRENQTSFVFLNRILMQFFSRSRKLCEMFRVSMRLPPLAKSVPNARFSSTVSRWDGGVSMVQGASRGIGLEFVRQLLEKNNKGHVVATCRNPGEAAGLIDLKGKFKDRLHILPLDVTDESTIEAAAISIKEKYSSLNLLINTSGVLSIPKILHPETTLSKLEKSALMLTYEINAVGPVLVVKHMWPLLKAGGGSGTDREFAVVANLSARVGSIGDNSLGGWHSYRSSKTALNQLTKTISVELARKKDPIICILLHPGTVDTDLSKPFQKNVPPGKLFTAEFSVQKLLSIINNAKGSDNGKFYAWDGAEIPW